jgi:SAM-dependent methyltransferase
MPEPLGDPRPAVPDGRSQLLALLRGPPELIAALDDGWLGTPGSALDLGCGLGTELAYLAKRGVDLTVGVDRSSVALKRAHQLHPAVRFMEAGVLRLPFGAQSFDIALDRGCFHYLQAADRPATPPWGPLPRRLHIAAPWWSNVDIEVAGATPRASMCSTRGKRPHPARQRTPPRSQESGSWRRRQQRQPEILQQDGGCVAAGAGGDRATRVGGGAGLVEAGNGHTVAGPAGGGAQRS